MDIADRIQFQQLNFAYGVSENQLRQIARLIYQTDPYIYPAMFRTEKDAEMIIPELIRAGDAMFSMDNLYVALNGDAVVGLILWHLGPLEWSNTLYYSATTKLQISPSPYLSSVFTEYLHTYAEIPCDTISVINVCVDENTRGNGLGKSMLTSFLAQTKASCNHYELFVLADNTSAVRLYEMLGFKITEHVNGFSIDHRDLPCYQMLKPNIK